MSESCHAFPNGKKAQNKSVHVLLRKNKKAISAVVATVFLIMITVAAVSIIWGTVIPFIKGNLDFDQRHVDLRVVNEDGYTVYDKDKGIAFVQIARGNDEETLHGMEVMIEFNGTTYKTTLRAPNPSQSKSYFFNMESMRDGGYLPKTVSVAPIFVLDARQVLGEITSKVSMPILNIVKEYEEMIIELGEENIINITEDETVQDLITYCPNTGDVGRDPWGGCPIAMGDIYSVHTPSGLYAYFDFEGTVGSWNTRQIKFKGDNCVVKENTCATITAAMNDESWWTNSLGAGAGIVSLNDKTFLNQTTQKCVGNNWFYIYDVGDC